MHLHDVYQTVIANMPLDLIKLIPRNNAVPVHLLEVIVQQHKCHMMHLHEDITTL